jgi:hypothetical protein
VIPALLYSKRETGKRDFSQRRGGRKEIFHAKAQRTQRFRKAERFTTEKRPEGGSRKSGICMNNWFWRRMRKIFNYEMRKRARKEETGDFHAKAPFDAAHFDHAQYRQDRQRAQSFRTG